MNWRYLVRSDPAWASLTIEGPPLLEWEMQGFLLLGLPDWDLERWAPIRRAARHANAVTPATCSLLGLVSVSAPARRRR